MTEKKIAHSIVLDAQAEEIRIDGVVFPYYILAEPEIMSVGDMALGAVEMRVLASNITLITRSGEQKPVVKASLDAELEWARRRATEIVIEGLADVVAQLPEAENERRRRAVVELQVEALEKHADERSKLLSLIGNLDGTITADELRERASEAMGW